MKHKLSYPLYIRTYACVSSIALNIEEYRLTFEGHGGDVRSIDR